jgi:hypothetical protein
LLVDEGYFIFLGDVYVFHGQVINHGKLPINALLSYLYSFELRLSTQWTLFMLTQPLIDALDVEFMTASQDNAFVLVLVSVHTYRAVILLISGCIMYQKVVFLVHSLSGAKLSLEVIELVITHFTHVVFEPRDSTFIGLPLF